MAGRYGLLVGSPDVPSPIEDIEESALMTTRRAKMLLVSLCAAWLIALPVSLSPTPLAHAAPIVPLSQCDDSTCH